MGHPPVWRIDRGSYPKLEFKVQYGESDYAFMSRLLEEAGIAFTFPDDQGSNITLSDKLEKGTKRGGAPIHYVEEPNQESEKELGAAPFERRSNAGVYQSQVRFFTVIG